MLANQASGVDGKSLAPQCHIENTPAMIVIGAADWKKRERQRWVAHDPKASPEQMPRGRRISAHTFKPRLDQLSMRAEMV
jgi:hypothetical protein